MAEEMNALDAVTDALTEKLSRAIDELDSHRVTVRIKTKKTIYDAETHKAIGEEQTEEEQSRIEKGLIDPAALKHLAAAIKELRAGNTDTADTSIQVVLASDAEELSR